MPTCWFCYKDAGEVAYHPACSKKFFGNATVPELTLDNKLLQELAEKTITRSIAVTGVQPKLSVTLERIQKGKDRLTIAGLWGEYILKPQQEKYPFMPKIEDLTMHLASVFKIRVCDHTLMRITDSSLVYLAKRFDRDKGQKIHFELILFSYLTGNNDMHLKNFSLLYREEGIALSPAYDLLNVALINPKDKEELGLYLNGKKIRIKKSDFLVLGKSLEIPDKVIENTFLRFASRNKEITDLIDSSFLGEEEKEKYKELWFTKQSLLTS